MLSKNDVAKQVAQRANLSQAKANQAVNAMLDSIAEALGRGEEVRISGFGSFRISERRERMGRHPRTGEPMKIEAARRPTFTPGSRLVGAVRGQGRAAA
ncbi:MAG: HU family DNA-binding protein [Chloroflexota bacterium]